MVFGIGHAVIGNSVGENLNITDWVTLNCGERVRKILCSRDNHLRRHSFPSLGSLSYPVVMRCLILSRKSYFYLGAVVLGMTYIVVSITWHERTIALCDKFPVGALISEFPKSARELWFREIQYYGAVDIKHISSEELARLGSEMSEAKRGRVNAHASTLVLFSGCGLTFAGGKVVGRSIWVPFYSLVKRFTGRLDQYTATQGLPN